MDEARFGPYRRLSVLGSGGPATAHLAEVVEPVAGLPEGSRVALKDRVAALLARADRAARGDGDPVAVAAELEPMRDAVPVAARLDVPSAL